MFLFIDKILTLRKILKDAKQLGWTKTYMHVVTFNILTELVIGQTLN